MAKAFVRKITGHPIDAQLARLKAFGIKDRDIYVEGRGAETFDAMRQTLRPTDTLVYVAADLRVFGNGRKEILGKTRLLEEKNVGICDVRDVTASFSEIMDLTLSELAKYNRRMDSKEAERTGRKGGIQKRKAYEVYRAEVAREDVIQRLVDAPGMTWKLAAKILGPPFSISSLRHHFPRTK